MIQHVEMPDQERTDGLVQHVEEEPSAKLENVKYYKNNIRIICIIITVTITLIFGRFIVILCTRWWVEGPARRV
jgi:hypothetical protein